MQQTYTAFKKLEVLSLEALLLFCKTIRVGGGLHPKIFENRIRYEHAKRGIGLASDQFFRHQYDLDKMRMETYAEAILRHAATAEPHHSQIPKEITAQSSPGRYALRWRTTGRTLITLTFLYPETFLNVTSPSMQSARKYATIAGLPEPVAQEIRPSQHLAQTHLTAQSWRDVSIPLGDIIDFINRYRK